MPDLYDRFENEDKKNKKVICLGKEFDSEGKRRDYFREELRNKLPELKKMEGFPIGDDDDIINLSDPPYYTACPNPWLNEFIDDWERNKIDLQNKQIRKNQNKIVKPFATDISEGRHTWLYKAHTYHTKVPPLAIKKLIEHYTQPGDIVYDGFAGSGMTGLAGMLCDKPRNTIINDISPIASFMSHCYVSSVDIDNYRDELNRLLDEVESELGWMFSNSSTKYKKIKYYVWSDVYSCNNCSSEIVFWEAAFDKINKKFKDNFECPICGTKNSKKISERIIETKYDKLLGKTVKIYKQIPVIVASSMPGSNRLTKIALEKSDYEILKKIDNYLVPKNANELLNKMLFRDGQWGDQWKNCMHLRMISHVHQLFSERQLYYLLKLLEKLDLKKPEHKAILFTVTSVLQKCSKLMVYNADGIGRVQKGTLYISSVWQEMNLCHMLRISSKDMFRAVKEGMWSYLPKKNKITHTAQVNWAGSTLNIPLKEKSIDYIFTDPPFGANIPYSEVNFIWESLLKVFTPLKTDIVQSNIQQKDVNSYHKLMELGFKELYRILKSGCWMTVEFSNTKAQIWNGIQNALMRAGFVIANVSALDKKQGSFKAVTTVTAVKQDLIISCYKPSSEFDNKFQQDKHTDKGIWEFIEEHLDHLPIHLAKERATTTVVERNPKILFDRLISFFVSHNLLVPIDAADFQKVLRERFEERDGMFFTHEQLLSYEEKKKEFPEYVQASIFVASEQDGIYWLKQRLEKEKMTYQDIQPDWMQSLATVRKGDTIPELMTILEENFLKNEEGRWYYPDAENLADLEKLRHKRLMREFNFYLDAINKPKAKKIKEVRVEALRAGFKECYQQKNFGTIVKVAEKIPQNLLLEDEFLLQFYDIAIMKV